MSPCILWFDIWNSYAMEPMIDWRFIDRVLSLLVAVSTQWSVLRLVLVTMAPNYPQFFSPNLALLGQSALW